MRRTKTPSSLQRAAKASRLGYVALLCLASTAPAANASVLGAPVSYTPGACVVYGDFYSCSAQLLNQFSGLTANDATYAPTAGPGSLMSNVVLGIGSSGTNQDNGDVIGTSGDDAYPTPGGTGPGGATPVDFSTKTSGPGGVADPAPTGFWDRGDTWDITLQALINYLTPAGGTRKDLLVGFNHNQLGSDPDLLAWSSIVVSDEAGATALPDLVFELKGPASLNPTDVLSFSSSKSLGSDPVEPDSGDPFGTPNDFVVSHGNLAVCSNLVDDNPTDCAAHGATWYTANANLGNRTDFILFSPELNAGLESWLAQGYDSVHVRIDLRHLVDGEEGAYLFAGDFVLPPGVRASEPSVLAMFAIGLFGLGLARKRTVAR